MKKSIPVVIFVVFLVIVPLLTWFNLNKGLDYRLQNRQELEIKDSIDWNMDTLHLFTSKTSILVTKPFDRLNDFVVAAQEMFVKDDNQVHLYSIGKLHPSLGPIPETYLKDVWARYDDKSIILIDTSGYIRNAYQGIDAEIAKLLEHTSVLVPEKKRGSIEFKNRN